MKTLPTAPNSELVSRVPGDIPGPQPLVGAVATSLHGYHALYTCCLARSPRAEDPGSGMVHTLLPLQLR